MVERVYIGLVAASAGTAVVLGLRGGEPAAAQAVVEIGAVGLAAPGDAKISYDRDIRPILSDRCFLCHGADANKRQADLRMDIEESAKADRKGKRAITAGDAKKSEAWRRINAHGTDDAMPPATSNKRALSEAERELVRRWIEQGAVFEPHWSFSPVTHPAVPEKAGEGWARNPIDRFIAAELDRAALRRSPEAGKQVLLRRVFMDLTGLPPTPEEIAAFEADTSEGAYEKVVDRLMNEEPYLTRYAERMAGPWLDQSRYADTCGIHMDGGRSAWPWRDWVLNAYRDHMKFDQFLTEQLAGDLLPNATQDQKVATGFNRNHTTTDEGGAIAEEYLVEYAVERASTTASVFLGLTMGCARCHDHKYDPVTQKDFYGMYAFFNSIEEPGLYSQTPDAMRAYEPFIEAPSAEQLKNISSLTEALKIAVAKRDTRSPEEDGQRAAFMAGLSKDMGVTWAEASFVSAASAGGATMTLQDDGSVLVSGTNPAKDTHTIVMRTEATDLRLVSLEALGDPSFFEGKVGRGDNGNVVLSQIRLKAVSVADPSKQEDIPFAWAWADVEQSDGDYRVVNAIKEVPGQGWAVGAHQRPGGRAALFLAEKPFGFPGGTELRVTLEYQSVYATHVFGRPRVSFGAIGDKGLEALPEASGSWYSTGIFSAASADKAYDDAEGPELAPELDLKAKFKDKRWALNLGIMDGRTAGLPEGVGPIYVARRVWAPTARKVELSLGSDDGIRVYVNGSEAFGKKADRSVAPDQDKATVNLRAGLNTLVFKIVNTGGPAGFYYRVPMRGSIWGHDLAAMLLPANAQTKDRGERADIAWRTQFSPTYRELAAQAAEAEKKLNEAKASVPKAMVMKELEKPRDTFVLTRGEYDKPDKSKPVGRAVPASLGTLAADAPRDRLGLARWLLSPENTLVSRVTVNRLWEQFFGRGIVRSTEDFGLQGEYPTHPELLDWLATEFREKGWDTAGMVRMIVTSATYRQASRQRPEAKEVDPDNRLLAYYPRQRLTAEEIRDQALYVSGLLVERMGGPSVKPYQPEGLWTEVAMPQSNTRIYERSKGDGLWRRSLYTYWKRAAPPPSMLTFDAPTRETCTIRRTTTNTPLQALVLWNDEQMVEAARFLAARTVEEQGEESAKIARLFERCTGMTPSAEQARDLAGVLAGFRERYKAEPKDAAKLLSVGTKPKPMGMDDAELAAWTMVASAVLSSDAAIVKK